MNTPEIEMLEKDAIARFLKFSGRKRLDIRAALIDCDGVLYDSMKNHTRAWVKLMQKNGIKCSRDEFYLYEGMVGCEIIKKKFKEGAGKQVTDDEAIALYGVKSRYFQELGEVPMLSGAAQMLQVLLQASLTCVLVTGSMQPSILERIDRDYPGVFDGKVTGHDVRHGKPNPEPYLKGAATAKATPAQCLAVENAPLGVQAAHAAGCLTIGVATGPIPEKELLKAGADIVYASMEILAQRLPKLLDATHDTTAE